MSQIVVWKYFGYFPKIKGICPVPSHDLSSKSRACQRAVDLLNIPTTAEAPKASRLRVCESHPVLDALVPWDPKKMVVRFAGDFFC